MSKYTTEVRYICETMSEGQIDPELHGVNRIDKIIEFCADELFNPDDGEITFPIFDEDYRMILCSKILKHYYTREIGLETVGLWKLKLSAKLNEIMPYYNQLYNSTLLEFNPLYEVDMYTRRDGTVVRNSAREGTSENKSSDTSVSNGRNYNRYSDTPQGGLDGIESNTYLTNASIDDTRSNSSNVGTSNTTDKTHERDNTLEGYLEHVYGKDHSVSYSKLLIEYRETFLNIDALIIEELEPLFMQIW